MAAILRGSWNWLKMAWDRQPVLVVAVGMSLLGPLFVVVSPGTKALEKEIENWPSQYILPSTKIEKVDTRKRLRQEHLLSWP